MSQPPPATSAGRRVVADRYELVEPVGSGAMGVVWRAYDRVLDRVVAVKEVTFPPGVPQRDLDVLRERTRREARAGAGLHHLNAVTVYDVVDEGDAPLIVMELLPARTLSEVVRSEGPLPSQDAARIGLALLGALGAAHARGILHRDVKPSNVLLCDDGSGRVVLSDFGIATSAADSTLTGSGVLLGTPSYLAPERIRGERGGPASDLWSLGALLYFAVEGRAPYDRGDVFATLTAVSLGEAPPMRALRGPLAVAVRDLLAPDPAARPDLAAVQRLLADATTVPVPAAGGAPPVADSPTTATRALPQVGPPTPRRPRRARVVAASAIAAVVVLVAAVTGAVLLAGRGGHPRTTASPPVTSPAPASTGSQTATGASPSPSGASEPAISAGPLPAPAGWRTYQGSGWSIAVPPSWTPGTFDGTPQYRDAATGRTVQVATTAPGGGGSDAVQDRRDQAAAFAQTHAGYQLIGIRRIDYRGYDAADWEFTYGTGGAVEHVLSRVFVAGGTGYSLYFETRSTDDWTAAVADFDRVSASFRTA